jgi:hypothetical protein
VLLNGLTDNLGQLLLVPHQQQDCPQLQHTAGVCSCGSHGRRILISTCSGICACPLPLPRRRMGVHPVAVCLHSIS